MARLIIVGALLGALVTPKPVEARHASDCPEYIVEWFDEQAHGACSIAWCESKFNQWASNSASGARGLFQFLRSTWARTAIGRTHGWDAAYDGESNAWAAFELSRGGRNWGEWSCKPWGALLEVAV